jgi:hypothetical protein
MINARRFAGDDATINHITPLTLSAAFMYVHYGLAALIAVNCNGF